MVCKLEDAPIKYLNARFHIDLEQKHRKEDRICFQNYVRSLAEENLQKKLETKDAEGNYFFLSSCYRLSLLKEDSSVNVDLDPLIAIANDWMRSQKQYLQDSLDSYQKERLLEVKEYPLFLQVLLRDEKIREKFLFFTVIQGNRPAVFIYFPYTVSLISNSQLFASRIGVIDSSLLKIKEKDQCKVLKMPCINNQGQTKFIEISNPDDEVTLSDDLRLSSKKILETFKEKAVFPGNIELFHDGIRKWNSHHFSMDGQEDWYRKIPPTKRFLTQEDLLSFLKLTSKEISIGQESHFIILKGTHLSRFIREEKIEMLNAHMSYSLIFPNEDKKGEFHLLPIGYTSDIYPRDKLDYLILGVTAVVAAFKCPDENIFHKERQDGELIIHVKKDDFQNFTNKIRDYIQKAENQEILFQYRSLNCTNMTIKILKEVFPIDGMEDLKKALSADFFNFKFQGLSKYTFVPMSFLPKKTVKTIAHRITEYVISNEEFKERRKFLLVNEAESLREGVRFGDNDGSLFHPERLITGIKKGTIPKIIDFTKERRFPITLRDLPKREIIDFKVCLTIQSLGLVALHQFTMLSLFGEA